MAHTTRATITITPTTKKIRSPRLSRPGCIALKPTSRSLGEPVDLAEPSLRQPRDVLADGGSERQGLGLVAAGPDRDLASLRVEDRHAPSLPLAHPSAHPLARPSARPSAVLAVADLDREAVPRLDFPRGHHDLNRLRADLRAARGAHGSPRAPTRCRARSRAPDRPASRARSRACCPRSRHR